jgi:hypothetical protein
MATSRRSGATIIEALLAIVMTSVLVLGAASLFGFVSQRVMRDSSETAVYAQATQLADEITKFVSQAKTCDLPTSGGVIALRCTMPANGVDTDQDGLADSFSLTSYDYSTDVETFATGKYVWFYFANASGTFGSTGTTFWRASPSTTANPAAGDLNQGWTFYYGGNARWNFIDSVTYTLDAANKKLTFTINASTYNRAERSAAGATGSSDNSKITITRTVFWRNYR